MSIREKYGKPKPKVNMKTWRVKGEDAEGREVYRIFPPTKSLAEAGQWFKYHAQHWGYKVPDGSDPSKTQHRVFGCPEKKNYNGMVEVSCAECELIAKRKQQYEAKKGELQAAGHDEETIKSMLTAHVDWLKSHNRDSGYYLGVKNLAGEYGVLVINGKMKKALETCIAKLKKEQDIDALDIDTGVWLEFIRSGKKIQDYSFSVEPWRENKTFQTAEGQKVTSQIIVQQALTDEDLEAAQSIIPDLGTIVRYATPEQVRELVASNGEPTEVARILDGGKPREQSAGVSAPAPKPAASSPSKPVPPPQEEADEEAALLAQLAAVRAKAKPPPPQATTSAPAPQLATTKPGMKPVNPKEASDEELLAMFSED